MHGQTDIKIVNSLLPWWAYSNHCKHCYSCVYASSFNCCFVFAWDLVSHRTEEHRWFYGKIYFIIKLLRVDVITEMAWKKFFLDIKECSVPPGALWCNPGKFPVSWNSTFLRTCWIHNTYCNLDAMFHVDMLYGCSHHRFECCHNFEVLLMTEKTEKKKPREL